MFDARELEVIMIMVKRASCTGDEATAVAVCLSKLEQAYKIQKDPQAFVDAAGIIPEDDDGNNDADSTE